MKIPSQPPPNYEQDNPQVGLKTLIHSEAKQLSVVHCYTLTTTSKTSSPPVTPTPMFRRCVMDDVIGTESGDFISFGEEDLNSEKEVVNEAEPLNSGHGSRMRQIHSRGRRRRQYPPPIHLLGGGNPWVLKREYSEGRLIVRAETVKHRESLEAHRENGRLVMKLVLVDPISEGCLKDDESETRGEACVSYDSANDSEPLWKCNGIGGANANDFMGRPDATPLRPITTPT